MPKFFFRNAPTTIKDALELSEDDFLKKYGETTATQESLKEAYKELRLKHLPPDQAKAVTFKVVPTDEKVVPITKAEKLKTEVEAEAESRNNPLINAARGRDASGINEDELREGEPVVTGKGTKEDPVKAVKRGRRRLQNADARDARMKALLQDGKSGKDILITMRAEGFTVHAPQVTLMKQSMGL